MRLKTMDDKIYRQAAIDVLDVGKELISRAMDNMDIVGHDRQRFEWGLGLIESYIEDIKDIPSAQKERNKGKWICTHLPASIGAKVLVEVNICSNCGYVVEGNNVSNFCPVCGSDMRGEDDDKSQ